MGFHWLESKSFSRLFSVSFRIIVTLVLSALLCAIPGFEQYINRSPERIMFVILTSIFVVIGILSLIVFFCGMLLFCMFVDPASISTKILWLFLFIITSMVGFIIYYLTIYRKHVSRRVASELSQDGWSKSQE